MKNFLDFVPLSTKFNVVYYTYKSSKPKVAAVNSKGQIKAKKAGKAVITVRSGKKTIKVKVIVKK